MVKNLLPQQRISNFAVPLFSKSPVTFSQYRCQFILVKLAKQGIAEVGLAEFKSAIISSKDIDAESIKKEPEGSDFNSSTCIKWWRLGDSNS